MESIGQDEYPGYQWLKHCRDELEKCAAEGNGSSKAFGRVKIFIIPACIC